MVKILLQIIVCIYHCNYDLSCEKFVGFSHIRVIFVQESNAEFTQSSALERTQLLTLFLSSTCTKLYDTGTAYIIVVRIDTANTVLFV